MINAKTITYVIAGIVIIVIGVWFYCRSKSWFN